MNPMVELYKDVKNTRFTDKDLLRAFERSITRLDVMDVIEAYLELTSTCRQALEKHDAFMADTKPTCEHLQNTVLLNGKIVSKKNSNGLWVVFNSEDEYGTFSWDVATRFFDIPTKDELDKLYQLNLLLGLKLTKRYWSSSEYSSSNSWGQNFSYGSQLHDGKNFAYSVRTVEYMTDQELINESKRSGKGYD